jgi:hypothetical protein
MRRRPPGERRVVMLLASEITYDARVQRSVRTLAAGGWDVTVAHVSQDGHATASPDGYRLIGVPWPVQRPGRGGARAVRRATAKRQKLAGEKKEAARRRTLKGGPGRAGA